MKKLILLALLAPCLAAAQVRVGASAGFTLDLPVVIPQLVVVTPGIQVVPDVEYEVFRADGYYWTRHEGGWYRSPNPRSGWVYMPRGVPPGLSRMPPGRYKHWRPEGPPPRGPAFGGPGFREERREDRHERREERYERHEDHDRDHGDHDRGRGEGKRGKHDRD